LLERRFGGAPKRATISRLTSYIIFDGSPGSGVDSLPIRRQPRAEKTGLEIIAFFGAARTDILRPPIAAPKKATISRPFASFASFAVKKNPADS